MIVKIGDDVVSNGANIPFAAAARDDLPETIVFTVENNGTKKITLGAFGLESGFKVTAYTASIAVGDEGTITVQNVTAVPGEFLRPFLIGEDFSINLTSEVTYTVQTYATRQRMNGQFGKVAIDKWADLDGTASPNDIEYAVYLATYDASREIDGYLSAGTYVVPFEQPIPAIIEKITAMKAGISLYTTRGMYYESYDKMMSTINKNCDSILADLRQGRMLLADVERRVSTSGPMVVD
jgi:phage gp36-like protein